MARSGAAVRPVAAAAQSARRPRVLVVDDDPAVRALIAAVVASAGCSVVTARDGLEALEYLRALGPRRRPDLILLDLEMPGLDGRGFAARYPALRGPHAPIVVISGAADARDAAARIGAADVLAKPFDLDELLDRVQRRLRYLAA